MALAERNVATPDDFELDQLSAAEALRCLSEHVDSWRVLLDKIEVGQQVARVDVNDALCQLLDASQHLRDIILSQDPEAAWQSKEELSALVAQIEDGAATAQKNRYAELMQVLASGTIKHRRTKTRVERLKQRDAALAELRTLYAQSSPPQIPGPAIVEWLNWACNLADGLNDSDLRIFQAEFPRWSARFKFCTSEDETNWNERSYLWHEGRSTQRSRL
jgi:hypothetical protein